MSHHKTIKDLEQYYSSSIKDNKEVKDFLKNITSDKEGYVFHPIMHIPFPHNTDICFYGRLIFILLYFFYAFSILHLFPWSGIVDEESQLSETFRVPDPKTGQMRRLISQIPPKEEEMFRNMIRRINTIVKVQSCCAYTISINFNVRVSVNLIKLKIMCMTNIRQQRIWMYV